MADSADMEALAKRYIELWQDQLSRASSDPSVTEAWRSVFETAAKTMGWTADTAAAYTAAVQGAAKGLDPAGPASAAPSSGDGGTDLADVLRRLDALEQRLSALETDHNSD